MWKFEQKATHSTSRELFKEFLSLDLHKQGIIQEDKENISLGIQSSLYKEEKKFEVTCMRE